MRKRLFSRLFVYACLSFVSAAHSLPACAADDDVQTVALKVGNLRGFVLGGQGEEGKISDGYPGEYVDNSDHYFLLYNVGQKKFLNMGGWWGTKTALGDHPRLFWLQQHSDAAPTSIKTTTYYQYPSAGKSVTVSPLVAIQTYAEGKVQVGSMEGYVRSNATYNSVIWQKADGTSEELFTDGYAPQGASFSTEKNIDFKGGDKIVASIKLPATTKDGKYENVLSVGDCIEYFGNDGHNKHNIHTYWNGTTLQVNYVLEGKYGRKNIDGIDANNPVVMTFSKDGVEVKNENTGSVSTKELISSNDLNGFFKAITGGKVNVGAYEGATQSHSTYQYIKVVNGDKEEVLKSEYSPNGERFECDNIDFAEGTKIVAKVTLPSTVSATENLLSVGKDIESWAGGARIHLYLATDKKVITSYTDADNKLHGNKQGIDISNFDLTKPITIEISKSGVSAQGETSRSTLDETYFKPVTVNHTEGKTGDILFNINNGYIEIVESNGKAIAEKITTTVGYTEKVEDVSKQVYIASNITKAYNNPFRTEEGHFLGYADETAYGGGFVRWEADCGVFVDRMIYFASKPKVVQWNLGYVDKTTGECTLSLTMPYTISDGAPSESDHTYYLTATNSVVHGLYANREDPTKYNYQNESSTKSLAVDLSSEISESSIPDDAKWKLIPLSVYRTILADMKEESSETLDLTFLLDDPDFSRDNGELASWTAEGDLTDGKLQIGHDLYYKTSTTDTSYTGDMSYNDAVASLGRYLDVSIQKGGHGTFSQTVKVYRSGWYEVKCQGKSNVNARLYAKYNSTKVNTPLVKLTTDDMTQLSNQSHWPYSPTFTKYNACVEMNDKNVGKTAEWANSVRIYIGDESLSLDNPGELTIGVEVPEQTEEVKDDLTVFDSFRLLYGGSRDAPDLILDENNTDLSYLDQTAHKYKQAKLHLVRTFTPNAWNTIMLPVNLNKSQFQAMFGEDARLAYLKEIKSDVARFYTVNNDDAEGVFLKAYMPYIIKVSVAHGNADSYTETLTRREPVDGSYDLNVTAPENHFVVDGVTLVAHQDVSRNYYDFANGKFTNKADGYDYCVVAAQEGNGAATYGDKILTSYGTLCKTYYLDTDKKGHIYANRPQLSDGNSYYFKNNTMWLRKSGSPYGLLGLRCWFAFNAQAPANAKPSTLAISINGVEDETTSIDDINMGGSETLAGKHANAVYDMNGQLVSHDAESLKSLPAGLYIVNGRKVVIK